MYFIYIKYDEMQDLSMVGVCIQFLVDLSLFEGESVSHK